MYYFPDEFKSRTEILLNYSFIPFVLSIKRGIRKVYIENLEISDLENLLVERIENLENLISSDWLKRIPREKMNHTFYYLWLELVEARTLLEEHRQNINDGIYFN